MSFNLHTLSMSAGSRALINKQIGPLFGYVDDLAHHFAGPWQALLEQSAFDKAVEQSHTEGLYCIEGWPVIARGLLCNGVIPLRSWFSLHYLRQWLNRQGADGGGLVVNVGAGFDTKSITLPSLYPDTMFIELDDKEPQAQKLQIMRESRLSFLPNVELRSVNFELLSAGEALKSCALYLRARGKPCFFEALGVIVYLTASAIEELFRSLCS